MARKYKRDSRGRFAGGGGAVSSGGGGGAKKRPATASNPRAERNAKIRARQARARKISRRINTAVALAPVAAVGLSAALSAGRVAANEGRAFKAAFRTARAASKASKVIKVKSRRVGL